MYTWGSICDMYLPKVCRFWLYLENRSILTTRMRRIMRRIRNISAFLSVSSPESSVWYSWVSWKEEKIIGSPPELKTRSFRHQNHSKVKWNRPDFMFFNQNVKDAKSRFSSLWNYIEILFLLTNLFAPKWLYAPKILLRHMFYTDCPYFFGLEKKWFFTGRFANFAPNRVLAS